MNEEQNGTISDGLIVLQILNRSEPLSKLSKYVGRPHCFWYLASFSLVTVLIDSIERTRETVATLPVL